MERYEVVAPSLNLRRDPFVRRGNRLAVLPEGQIVERLAADGDSGWWSVATDLHGASFTGHAARRYLRPLPAGWEAPTPAPSPDFPAVHLREGRPEVRRDTVQFRAFPIGEPDAPRRGSDGTTPAAAPDAIDAIVDWLAVERSERYRPAVGRTYCNVYAYDVACLAGAYLPRVWWTEPALVALAAGENVPARYGTTLREMTANDLLRWLGDHGRGFGWRRLVTPDAAQDAANAGELAVACAERRHAGSGHIAIIVPETFGAALRDDNGEVVRPLQSQAGAKNFRRSTGTRAWWSDEASFRDAAWWCHRPD